ncbi:MAG: adenylate kinase [Candidatus Aenigmarchaeota archaeon]|nr:adenylate kinase [Candidatus Aenigmarchaeota archaeon]
MNIIFLGPPGSGKGTYSSRIKDILHIPHISTGDILRNEIKNNTEIGKKAKEYCDKGELVPDDIILEILKKRLSQEDAKNGFILDGFPRTISQAQSLEKFAKIDVALNLVIPEDILIEKLTSRRVCEKCGAIYNIANINRNGIKMPPMLPEKPGICDKCGGKLIQRRDDKEEIIKDRLKVYKEQTEPLIKYYRDKGILVDVKIHGPPEIMVPEILKILENK